MRRVDRTQQSGEAGKGVASVSLRTQGTRPRDPDQDVTGRPEELSSDKGTIAWSEEWKIRLGLQSHWVPDPQAWIPGHKALLDQDLQLGKREELSFDTFLGLSFPN